MIFQACNDDREAVLQQELLLYLAPLIVAAPDVFAFVLRVRIGYAGSGWKLCDLDSVGNCCRSVHIFNCAGALSRP
jgi:hypothetical protein